MAQRNERLSIEIAILDRTRRALAGIRKAFGSLTKVFFNLKTAILGAAGAGGIGLLVAQSLKATDQLAKTAARIGTTTEALSRLQYAGQLTGVQVATMNMALQRFTRRTAEAARGTGEAKGALLELNVDARELIGLPLDQRMAVLADAFSKVESEADKTRLAFKLFDSEGVALVNTLKLGEDGLTELFGEAQALGAVMTTRAANGVERANDALFRLSTLGRGVTNLTVAGLAPAIEALADIFTNKLRGGVKDSNDSFESFATTLAVDIISAVRDATVALFKFGNMVRQKFYEIQQFVFDWKTSLNMHDLTEQESEFIKKFEKMMFAAERFEDMMAQGISEEQFGSMFGNIDQLRAKVAELTPIYEALMERIGQPVAPTATGADGILEFFNKLIRAAQEATTEAVKPLEEVDAQIQQIGFFDHMAEGFTKLKEKIGDVQPDFDRFAMQTMATFTNAFTDAITGAKKFGEAMKSMAKSVVDSLIKMLVQYYITAPLFEAITGKPAPGTGTTPGGGSGIADDGLARGGVATGGRPYVVGEKGPELFIPGTTGRVIPNNQMGGGGVTVVQNINVTTGVQQTVRAEIANLLPQISNAAKAAVADARMRGGGFSKAMVGA